MSVCVCVHVCLSALSALSVCGVSVSLSVSEREKDKMADIENVVFIVIDITQRLQQSQSKACLWLPSNQGELQVRVISHRCADEVCVSH